MTFVLTDQEAVKVRDYLKDYAFYLFELSGDDSDSTIADYNIKRWKDLKVFIDKTFKHL